MSAGLITSFLLSGKVVKDGSHFDLALDCSAPIKSSYPFQWFQSWLMCLSFKRERTGSVNLNNVTCTAVGSSDFYSGKYFQLTHGC